MELDNLPLTNRYKLLRILGGKCRICLIDKIEDLVIDHIYNDSTVEETRYNSSEKIYDWYLQHENQAFRILQPLCKEHYKEKHNLVLGYKFEKLPNTISKTKIFMDILREFEGENRKPVGQTTLIHELVKSGKFTEEESKHHIKTND